MQPIELLIILFYIILINFIFTLPVLIKSFNNIFIITYKFSKRIILIFKRITFTVK